MSDIIPFPQNREKLIKDIKSNYAHQQYDAMYDTFMLFEKDFELDTELALLKCEMLLRMEQYLELREEAIILLKQGYDAYNRLIVYYMTSLHGLGQYFECIELFNQIIDQVDDHDIRMQLFPIKEDALMQLNQNKKNYIEKMKVFPKLDTEAQLYLLFNMMHEGQFGFAQTFAEILSQESLHANVQTILLDYLKKAQFKSEVTFEKNGHTFSVVPETLTGIEYSDFTQKVIPAVLELFEVNYGEQLRSEISQMLQDFAIGLYPLDIEEVASFDDWVHTLYAYIEEMLHVMIEDFADNKFDVNESVLRWIHEIEKNFN